MSKPIGLSSSVAGSSFIVVRKTSAKPPARPGAASRQVTVKKVRSCPRPRLRDASSTEGCTRIRADWIAPDACGRKSTT